MRYWGLAGLGAILCAASAPALAQAAAKPDTMACPKEVAELATCYGAKLPTGAYVLAAMPKNWNGHLIVFAHGGPSLTPPVADDSIDDLAKYSIGVRMGYAWVASTYRKEGYGVRMAADDTDDARKFFIDRVAKPTRTLMHGASYGGLVGAKLLETYGKNYDGAFFNSGAIGGAELNYQFRVDLAAVYQYYCKNLPGPGDAQYPFWTGLPLESKMTMKDVTARMDTCTGITKPAAERSPAQKQNLANILGVMRFPVRMFVRHMQSATFTLREVPERMGKGKSAFGNRNVRYRGSNDDAALNAGIARFDADPAAIATLKADGVPNGTLPIPVVSIHSFNDPQAAVEAQYEYRKAATDAGNGARLVQAYTDEDVHTAQSAPELAASFNALQNWIDKGTKPTAQSIAAACTTLAAKYQGPCRYHPDYQPKPYNTRFARAAAQ